MVLAAVAIVVIAITLLPRWTRRRVRVTAVSRVRSEMARHQWPLLSPLTPVDGVPSPRNEPSTGPKQPDGTAVLVPPTEDNLSRAAHPERAAQAGCAVRRRRRVVVSANDLTTTLGPGWRLS